MKLFGELTLKSAIRITSITALAATIALGTGISSASAQSRKYRDVYGNGRNVNTNRNDIQRQAISNGYSEGFEEGTRARRDRRGSDFRRSSPYKSARGGYNRSWNAERDYQSWFRQGFERGFNDAFNGRGRNNGYGNANGGYYGNNGGYNNGNYNGGGYGYGGNYGYDNGRGDLSQNEVAQRGLQNGYYAGIQRGRYDAQQRNQQNPQGHGAYQFAFDGYDREWGSAQTYQQSYRNGFLRGYQEGYGQRGGGYSTYRRR